MNNHNDPSNLMGALIEVAIGLLVVVVALGIAVWILSRIWLWVLGGALVALSVWLFIVWCRQRNSRWY